MAATNSLTYNYIVYSLPRQVSAFSIFVEVYSHHVITKKIFHEIVNLFEYFGKGIGITNYKYISTSFQFWVNFVYSTNFVVSKTIFAIICRKLPNTLKHCPRTNFQRNNCSQKRQETYYVQCDRSSLCGRANTNTSRERSMLFDQCYTMWSIKEMFGIWHCKNSNIVYCKFHLI